MLPLNTHTYKQYPNAVFSSCHTTFDCSHWLNKGFLGCDWMARMTERGVFNDLKREKKQMAKDGTDAIVIFS